MDTQEQRLTAWQRIDLVSDKFEPFTFNQHDHDNLKFPNYKDKLTKAQEQTGLDEAIVVGKAWIDKYVVVLAVMDSHFMMGTLNTGLGQRLRFAMQEARLQQLPFILFTASGGARMQEGIYALLQMNSLLYEFEKLNAAEILTINILTDPTMGGTSASIAFKSDYVFGEAGATIGFVGRRVIEQAIREPLPSDFQKAHHLLTQGLIDDVIERNQLRSKLVQVLKLHDLGVNNGFKSKN